jgi:putative peptidoglycan lipid II flippase
VRRTVSEGMSLMMVLNVPATVGLVILATPIIRVIFERRAFTPLDTAATAAALQFYAIGLIGYSIVRIVSPVFYALGQNRTPVMVSIAAVAVNIVSSVALVRPFGYRGLAARHRRLRPCSTRRRCWCCSIDGWVALDEARTLASLGRILIASAVMGAIALAMDRATSAWIPGAQLTAQIVRLIITIGCSLVVLAAWGPGCCVFANSRRRWHGWLVDGG